MEAPKEMKENENVISFKVFIDKVREKVVFAESDKDFIDILFSFLTLPMGTIIKQLRSNDETIIGCMKNLYGSIEKNIGEEYFQNSAHKRHVLHHRNSCQAHCRKLKINVDDSKAIKYYLCEDCCDRQNALLNYLPNGKCLCGKLMNQLMYNVDDYDGYRTDADAKEGVFVRGTTNYIITDDLQVMPSSTTATVELLVKLGVQNANALKEKTFNLGKKEVLSLLRLSLFSRTPLTDMVLMNRVDSDMLTFEPRSQVRSAMKRDTLWDSKHMTLKVICSKSDGKVLYAEAKEDFVNYLLALPAVTLGSAVKLLEKTPSLGGICNLYKSVEGSSLDHFMKSEDMKAKLLSPKLGIQMSRPTSNGAKYQMTNIVNNDYKTIHPDPMSHICKNEEATWKTIGDINVLKRPATYVVTDDLVMTPLSQVSSISMLNRLNVPVSDLEARVVTFGEEEARRLLEASLMSESALTAAFSESPKKSNWFELLVQGCSSTKY